MGVCLVLLFMSGNCQELLPQEQQCRIRENPTLSIQTLQLHQTLVCTGKGSTEGAAKVYLTVKDTADSRGSM